MATFNKFQSFVEALAEGKHNLATDTFEVALCAAGSPPVNTNTILANLTQISYTNLSTRSVGTAFSSAQTGGVYKLCLTDLVLTASGAVAAFQYVVLFDQTSPSDELIGWYDYGAPVTLANLETFTIDFDATNGVLQLT